MLANVNSQTRQFIFDVKLGDLLSTAELVPRGGDEPPIRIGIDGWDIQHYIVHDKNLHYRARNLGFHGRTLSWKQQITVARGTR